VGFFWLQLRKFRVMIQYVLKRELTGSTVTVYGSENINQLWSTLDRMLVALSALKVMGKDHKPLSEGVLP